MTWADRDPNGTHTEALAWAVVVTDGPVVEMGMGWHSTPMLHGLCEGMGRELYSVDPLQEWIEPFRRFECSWHHLIHDESIGVPDIAHAGLLFMDHQSPQRPRADMMREAHPIADLVVVHDSEPGKQELYAGLFPCWDGMEDAFKDFEHRRDFTGQFPWTTALWDGDLQGTASSHPFRVDTEERAQERARLGI